MNKDIVEKGVSSFHNPHSCAQAVYAACADADAAKMDYLKANSGGRAPDGICGALFAAKELSVPSEHARIESEFKTKVGALRCREIKGVNHTPCAQCVRSALEIL